MQNITPLYRENRQMGISSEVTHSPKTLKFRAKQRKVVIRRMGNMNVGQLEPGLQRSITSRTESGRATTLRFVVMRTKPSMVAPANPTPSTRQTGIPLAPAASTARPKHHRTSGSFASFAP
jgi:hypothetical protein